MVIAWYRNEKRNAISAQPVLELQGDFSLVNALIRTLFLCKDFLPIINCFTLYGSVFFLFDNFFAKLQRYRLTVVLSYDNNQLYRRPL